MMNTRSRVTAGIVLILSITLSSLALPVAVGADDEEETGSGVSVDGIAGVSDGVESGEPAGGTSTGDLNNPLGRSSGGKTAGAEGEYRSDDTSTGDGGSSDGGSDGDPSESGGGDSGQPGGDTTGAGTNAGAGSNPTSGQPTGVDPILKLMTLLIMSEVQAGESEAGKTTPYRTSRDVVNTLLKFGLLRDDGSDGSGTDDPLKVLRGVMESPPPGSAPAAPETKDD